MYVLVTGGAGYIGCHTVRALQKNNFKVIVLDNLICGHKKIVEETLKVPLIIGDIGNKKLVKSILSGKHPKTNGEKVFAIIHFAAYAYVGESVANPLKYYSNNVKQSISFFEVIVEESYQRKKDKSSHHIPIVFSSSCATYGIPEVLPIIESMKQSPINPYGKTKLIVEEILKDFYSSYDLPSVIFRYFNAAGADPKGDIGENHNPETHLIPLAFDAATKKSKNFKIFGNDYPTFDGTCIRDFIHVMDLAEGHARTLEYLDNNKSQTLNMNIGTGTGTSVLDLVNTFQEVNKIKIPYKFSNRREGDVDRLVSDNTLMKSKLEWAPIKDLRDMCKDGWKWQCNNPKGY